MAKALTITNQAEWDAASRDDRLHLLLGDVWEYASEDFREEMRAAHDKGLAQGLALRAQRDERERIAA